MDNGKQGKTNNSLHNQLQALPKVDLHRHLEGSLRLQTLAEIALEHGIDLPSYDIDDLRPFATVKNEPPDFQRFLQKFRFLRKFYPTQAAVQRIAYEAVVDAAQDNVKYLELRFNPIALSRAQGFPLNQVAKWVCETVAQAERDQDIHVNLILQIGRDEDLDTAEQIAEVALAHRDKGIVGLDLAGDEILYPARRFASIFQQARREGLHITVHAGEAGGPENVSEAIELLMAERIGHGIRSIEHSGVLELLREREVALEVCPTSNLQTGVVSRLGYHPLPDLLDLNLRVTLNTDDPSVSDTTLTDEYRVTMLTMRVTMEQIKRMIIMGIENSFQTPDERQRQKARFKQELGMNDNRLAQS